MEDLRERQKDRQTEKTRKRLRERQMKIGIVRDKETESKGKKD